MCRGMHSCVLCIEASHLASINYRQFFVLIEFMHCACTVYFAGSFLSFHISNPQIIVVANFFPYRPYYLPLFFVLSESSFHANVFRPKNIKSTIMWRLPAVTLALPMALSQNFAFFWTEPLHSGPRKAPFPIQKAS